MIVLPRQARDKQGKHSKKDDDAFLQAKMAKMLRLARFKRILSRSGSNVHIQQCVVLYLHRCSISILHLAVYFYLHLYFHFHFYLVYLSIIIWPPVHSFLCVIACWRM